MRNSVTMALGQTLYNTFFRRSSTFYVSVLVGAVVFERIFDKWADDLWENMNRGVSRHTLSLNSSTDRRFFAQRLWDHIKHNYETQSEE